MARWLHALQQFFSIIHRPGDDHGNADGLSRAPSSPCRQCTRPDCPPVVSLPDITEQPFDSESTGSSADADSIPIHSGEDWVAQLDDDLSQPTAIAGDSFRILTLQREYPTCITLHAWISSGEFPPWTEVKGLHPELRSLWYHRNNLSLDDNGIIWRKRSSQSSLLQLLVPIPGQEQPLLGLPCLFVWRPFGQEPDIGLLGSPGSTARGCRDDVKEWLTQCVACVKRKYPGDSIILWEIFRPVIVGIE